MQEQEEDVFLLVDRLEVFVVDLMERRPVMFSSQLDPGSKTVGSREPTG